MAGSRAWAPHSGGAAPPTYATSGTYAMRATGATIVTIVTIVMSAMGATRAIPLIHPPAYQSLLPNQSPGHYSLTIKTSEADGKRHGA